MTNLHDYSELIEVIPDAALVVDRQGRIVLCNRLASQLFGYAAAELKALTLDALLPEEVRDKHAQHLEQFFAHQQARPMGQGLHFKGVRKDGSSFHVDIMLSQVKVEQQAYAIAFIRDATQAKLLEAQIRRELALERRQAYTDYLTGLPNRRAFHTKLEQQLELLKRDGEQFCVALIDIDDFKWVNDQLGHAEGDRALQMLARAIRESCREQDFIARIGGDEFVSIHPHAASSAIQHIMQRVQLAVQQLGQQQGWPVSVSIGTCYCSQWHSDYSVERILQIADEAMYAGKLGGKNQINAAPLTT